MNGSTESLRLIEVADPGSTADFSIVFVHGLGGDGESTWSNGNSDGFWPKWLAEDFPAARIWSLDYPAGLTRWTDSRKTAMPLPDRATGIVELLRIKGAASRPLIFVAHSLGGLLVKQILRSSADHHDPANRAVALATRAVIFLATPHSGSTLANLAEALARVRARIVPAGLLLRWSPATLALKRNCPHLRNLGQWYRNKSPELGTRTYAMYETTPVGPTLVVEQSSADPGVNGCEPVAVSANHFEIAKPLSRESLIYLFVTDAIGHHVTGERERAANEQPKTQKRVRLAVLPLRSDKGVLGSSMGRTLSSRLASLGHFRVIEFRSVEQLDRRQLTVSEISDALGGVDFIVDGDLIRDEDMCLVTAQLLDIRRHRPVWEREYRLPWTSFSQIQSEVVLDLATNLPGKLAHDDKAAIVEVATQSVEALSAFERAEDNRNRFNNIRRIERFKAADDFYEEALRHDPDYADAWAGRGFLHLLRWETDRNESWLNGSRRYFEKAIHCDTSHPIACCELGYLDFIDGQKERGLEKAESAAAQHSGRPIPQNVLALLYQYVGFYETAISWTQDKVIPLLPLYTYPHTNNALCCLLSGDLSGGLEWSKKASKIDPLGFTPILLQAAIRFSQMDLDGAAAACERGLRMAPDHVGDLFRVVMGWIHARRGDLDSARGVAEEHRDSSLLGGAYDPYFISLYALAGMHESAVELLRKQTTYASSYRYLVSDETLHSLRANPGFRYLLGERHAEWKRHQQRWQSKIPEPPPSVPSPEEILNSIR